MTAPALAAGRRDVRVISLIGTAHGFSHFYQLVLPSLFVILNAEVGYGFERLGYLTAVFFCVSGVAQAPMGFLVDRFGARPFLYAGLGLLAGATLLYGVIPGYGALIALSALAGLGNSVFHPADFSILGASVRESHMGRAFSIHSIGGFIGYAAAPAVVVPLAGALGWRAATITVGAAGLAFLALLLLGGANFRDSRTLRDPAADRPTLAQGVRLLLQIPFLMYLVFFTLLAFALVAMQTQGASAITNFHGVSAAAAAAVVTAFLVGNPLGAIAGGVAADRTANHEGLTTICLLGAALFAVLGGLSGASIGVVGVLLFASGFCFGAFFPSRDLLVRRATPAGQGGKVFGFVYSGLDLGSAVGPPVFGWFVDQSRPEWIFLGIAFALCLCVSAVYGARLGRTDGR